MKNLTPLGFSARAVPYNGTGSGVYNSDLAFKGNFAFQGTYEGFRVIDVTNKSNPIQLLNYAGCNVGQGDVIVYENILIRSWDAPANAGLDLRRPARRRGLRGHPHLRHHRSGRTR